MLDEMAQDEYLEWNLTASPYDRGTFQELALQHPPAEGETQIDLHDRW